MNRSLFHILILACCAIFTIACEEETEPRTDSKTIVSPVEVDSDILPQLNGRKEFTEDCKCTAFVFDLELDNYDHSGYPYPLEDDMTRDPDFAPFLWHFFDYNHSVSSPSDLFDIFAHTEISNEMFAENDFDCIGFELPSSSVVTPNVFGRASQSFDITPSSFGGPDFDIDFRLWHRGEGDDCDFYGNHSDYLHNFSNGQSGTVTIGVACGRVSGINSSGPKGTEPCEAKPQTAFLVTHTFGMNFFGDYPLCGGCNEGLASIEISECGCKPFMTIN